MSFDKAIIITDVIIDLTFVILFIILALWIQSVDWRLEKHEEAKK